LFGGGKGEGGTNHSNRKKDVVLLSPKLGIEMLEIQSSENEKLITREMYLSLEKIPLLGGRQHGDSAAALF